MIRSDFDSGHSTADQRWAGADSVLVIQAISIAAARYAANEIIQLLVRRRTLRLN